MMGARRTRHDRCVLQRAVAAAALLSVMGGSAIASDAGTSASGGAPAANAVGTPAWVTQLAPPPPRSFAVPASPARPAAVAPAAPVAPGSPATPVAPSAPAAPGSSAAAAAGAVAAAAAKPATLRGTLGSEQVQATIRPKYPAEDGVEGSYFIFGGKQNILLAGEIEGESLWMEESENGVDVSGQWEGTRKGDLIEGTWQSVDGSVSKPFQLKIMPPAPVQP